MISKIRKAVGPWLQRLLCQLELQAGQPASDALAIVAQRFVRLLQEPCE